MDKLSKYKLDKAFTEGVEVRLDEAPDVVFLVRLPSRYNRAYQQALYAGIDLQRDDDGNVVTSQEILVTRWAQEDAFVEACLISKDGEPLPENFGRDYPEAVAELMEKASKLGRAIEDKVESSVKKSPGLSTGSADGPGESDSMPDLKQAAS